MTDEEEQDRALAAAGWGGGLCPGVPYILRCPKHKHCPCCPSTTWFDLSGLQSHPGQGNLASCTWFLPPSDLIQVLGPSLPTGRWRGGDGHKAPLMTMAGCASAPGFCPLPKKRVPGIFVHWIPALSRVSCLGTRLGLTLPPAVSPPNSGESCWILNAALRPQCQLPLWLLLPHQPRCLPRAVS